MIKILALSLLIVASLTFKTKLLHERKLWFRGLMELCWSQRFVWSRKECRAMGQKPTSSFGGIQSWKSRKTWRSIAIPLRRSFRKSRLGCDYKWRQGRWKIHSKSNFNRYWRRTKWNRNNQASETISSSQSMIMLEWIYWGLLVSYLNFSLYKP